MNIVKYSFLARLMRPDSPYFYAPAIERIIGWLTTIGFIDVMMTCDVTD